MNIIVQRFLTPRRNGAKRLLFVALFGTFALGLVFLTGGHILSTPVAHAEDCATAIALSNSVSNSYPHASDTIIYSLSGSISLTASTSVTVTDPLGTGLTFVSANPSPGTYSSATGIWDMGSLNGIVFPSLTITATVDADATGTIDNIPTAQFNGSSCDATSSALVDAPITIQGVSTPTSTPTSTIPSADLSISKTVSPSSSTVEHVSSTVDYTITVTNNSTSTPSDGVVATDVLPSELTFESATASAGTSYASSTSVWTIGTLLSNAVATLDIHALVNSAASSTLWNTATVSASTTDPNTANDQSSISINVQQPTSTPTSTIPSADLSISKTVSPSSVTPGSTTTVEYIITVMNGSTSTTSTAVTVNDPLPSGITFESATPSSSYNATSGVWTVGDLSAGASSTLTITAEVNASVNAAITNTATVSASTTDPNAANNSAQATITMQSSGCTSNCGGGGSVYSNVGIVKTVDNANPAPGSTIHYTLTVSDAGQSATYGVAANDLLPAGVTFVSASSTDGSYTSATGVWTIGALNLGETETLVITATVNAPAGTTIANTATVSEIPTIVDPDTSNNSSTVTITVAGGGIVTTPTSTGQVLGASCGLYLTSYIHPNRQNLNDPAQVKKLQTFLNMNLGLHLPITGYYGAETVAAVNQFQIKYHTEVLHPWTSFGLPTDFTPTSYVYQTTQRWINLIMCPALNLPLPALKVDNSE